MRRCAVRYFDALTDAVSTASDTLEIPDSAFTNTRLIGMFLRDAKVFGKGVRVHDMQIKGDVVTVYSSDPRYRCVELECLPRYGVVMTKDGSHPDGSGPGSEIIGWHGPPFDSYAKALEANDLDGWRGYVRLYPSGAAVPPDSP